MSQKDQGNKASKHEGASKPREGKMPKTVSQIYGASKDGRERVGSTPGHGGVTFPIHDHPDKSDLHSPEQRRDEKPD